jgi:hypothetical protein
MLRHELAATGEQAGFRGQKCAISGVRSEAPSTAFAHAFRYHPGWNTVCISDFLFRIAIGLTTFS